MNGFLFWRLANKIRQVDVEIKCGIRRWRVADFEIGKLELTPDEMERLSSLTGLPAATLVAQVGTSEDQGDQVKS